MKKLTTVLTVFLTGLALIFSAGAAQALSISFPAYAELEIFDFSFTGDLRFEFVDGRSYAYAYVQDDLDTDFDESDSFAEAGVEYAIGAADVTLGETVDMAEETGAAADGIISEEGYAEAGAEGGLDLILSGEGELTLYANYYLEQTLFTENPGEYASAYSEAGLFWNNDFEYAFLENSVSDGNFGAWDDSGTLQLTIPVSGEVFGTLGGWVYNTSYAYSPSAQVPEPASLLLFGSGLVGLWTLGRNLKR